MNKQKIFKLSAASLAGLGLAFSVFAQNASPTPVPSVSKVPPIGQELRDIRKDGMEEIKNLRQSTREEMENLRRENQAKIREAQNALKAKIEAKRIQLQKDLKRVKDARKSQATEKIDKSLDTLNDKMTGKFVKALDQLDDVLVRIDERTDRAASKSIDVAPVRTAIANAQTKIQEARAAVQAQAGKTYTITVTNDSGLKDSVKKTREVMRADLNNVQNKVKAAKNAVHDAAVAYAKAHGRKLPELSPEVLASVSPSPTVTTSPLNN